MSTTRMNTRVIVLVHSHQLREELDLSRDVFAFQSSKSVKGSGGFTITVVPRRNYLNYIFPNDVVNLYVDPGDGKRGFIRTCFGYVDRIDREESVDNNGAMQTRFQIVCTDFTKAVDKTEIYFNPSLANREEFVDNDSGQSLLGGGHALRTRGIIAHGTPAQFVENLLQLLLGFGQQWVLPRSYPTSNFLDKSRSRRRQRAKNRLPSEVRTALTDIFGTDIEDVGLDVDLQQVLLQKQFALASGLQKALGGVGPLNENSTVQTVLADNQEVAATNEQLVDNYTTKQAALSSLLGAAVQLQAYQTLLRESQRSSAASILDLLSLDFVEALTVDGYITSTSIWTNQGTLSSILYGWSNENVNELCFDLRPVAADAPDQCFGTRYSKDSDELEVNTHGRPGFEASVAAVRYVPAVIFREYPYSIVNGLDLSRFNVLGSPVGFQPFGPVFALQPNTNPGRRIYNYQWDGVDALTPEKCLYDTTGAPLKHLDVVVINNSDVKSDKIGRSDNDIFNLFELYALGPVEQWKYILREILPILTPVSIQRHGLRLRQVSTKFANYSRNVLCDGGSGVDTAQIRRNLIRWALLLDHWYQHNVEYLNGSIELRGMPEIRVGYRLDWADRHESYYVESVAHSWEFAGPLITHVQVSRGQRNDPFPAYIPPILSKTGGVPAGAPTQPVTNETTVLTQSDQDRLRTMQSASVAQQGGGDRSENGRLAKFFPVRDTRATAFAVGGEAKFSGENDVDRADNIPGVSVLPNTDAQPEQSITKQLGDFALPLKGKDEVT